jgi:aspartate/methionine/tyrosine aminotransferase
MSELRWSARAQRTEPFYVMEVAKAASDLARRLSPADAPMVFLNIGEPDFTAPARVQAAAAAAIAAGKSQYTDALGWMPLRERIAAWYGARFQVGITPQRIAVTAGASAALQLACLALINEGDEILMPDPCYPCNRQFVQAAGGKAVLIPSGPEQRFQLREADVRAHWGERTRGVLLASPSNPTGTSIARDELERIARFVKSRGGVLIVDEIYLGLSFDPAFEMSALSLPDGARDCVVSINSFSKYFNMTGWRLGWISAPESLMPAIERLSQNLYICASTIAQHAALACFEADTLAEYEARRAQFKLRRDRFVPALNALGLQVPVMPDGAFYAYADCSDWCARLNLAGSWELAFHILEKAHLAVTPGKDFSPVQGARYLRFSTANAMPQLETALERLAALKV